MSGKTIFEIFMAIGQKSTYGTDVSGISLAKINTSEFISNDEALKYINETDSLPSEETYYIIPVLKFKKTTRKS